MLTLILIVLFWVVCGFFAYGKTFAYFQRKYPLIAAMDEESDRAFALLMAITGPVGLIVALLKSEHGMGWRWK